MEARVNYLNSEMAENVIDNHQQERLHLDFNVGDKVWHKKWKNGVIKDREGKGKHARVYVDFEGGEKKWLILKIANLQK